VLNLPSQYGSTLETGSGAGVPAADLRTLVSGERRKRALDSHGRWLSESIISEPGGVVLETATVAERDAHGEPSRITYSDGTEQSTVSGSCCGPDTATDRAGVVTKFTYDGAGRRESETRDGVRTRTVFDGAGRPQMIYRGEVDATGTLVGAEQLLRRNIYDSAGRLGETRDALDRVTTLVETVEVTGVRKVKTTFPGGGTQTEIYHADGTLQAVGDVGDTAAHPRKYEYGIAENLALPGGGVTNARFTKEIRLREGGAETEWTKTYTDMLGRTCRIETAQGGAAHPTIQEYNAVGQLVKTTDPDGVTMLYTYNAEGEREVEALDLNRNGVIDYAGTDRITKRVRAVTLRGTTKVRRETVSQWLTEGADTPTVISEVDVTPNGLQTWSTVYGLLTERQTFQTAGLATTTTTFPDLSTLVETTDHGRPAVRVRKDAAAATLEQQSYAYVDPFKRLTSVTDARNGVTDFTYYADDQIETVTSPDPDGAGPLPRLVTTTFYDAAGRKQREVQPDGGEVLSDYWPTGELKSTSGARTYPVSYSYDPQGRLKTLTTRQGAPGVGEAVTTWNYSPAGLLSGKQYHDGTGPAYTYSWAGRLATRQWVRGITTAYAPNNAGEVASITYSDGTTPGATFNYDRRGLPATIADASGSRTLTHTAEGQPDDESYTAGLFAGLTVERGYDALRRRNALAVPTLGASVSTGYGYDGASRLQTVTNGQVGATYTREPNSALLASVAFTRNAAAVMTTSRTHDYLDRQLSQATSVVGAGSAATSAGYAYNAASQRTKLTREDGSYWSYGYDALGQVTGGSRKWSDATPVAGQQFAYAFDQIGNRQSATVNGRVSSYAPNLLNQYESRTVPGAVDVLGSAQPEAIVTVNGQLTARKGSYYAGTAPVSNAAAAVDAELKIVGVRNHAGPAGEDAVTEEIGRSFVPQTPESFTHDLDGNLTSDGRFSYTWDGENRLIAVEAHATTPATAKVKLTMLYDAHSRRVQKQVHTWNAGTSAYQLSTTLRFLYDGWNLIAELNASNQVVRSYVWGLDLSGSLQGAGGVGGLLVINDIASSASYLPAYDGNGNILALVNATDGTLAAQYEYGPFGEPLRATGELAKVNPFRFSTKYTDDETSLCHYGYRYHQPTAGRWLSRDPIQEFGGENIYAGIANDAVNYFDALGLQAWIICNRCANNPHGPMTCITYDDSDGTGKSSQPYRSNEYRNDPIVPANVEYDVKPKRREDMYPENLETGPRNVALGKVRAIPTQKYPNPRAEFPEGTPSITLPGLPTGQINPARPNLNNHRVHGPGDSLGYHTTGNCGAIQDMMNRNLSSGGTTYTIYEVKCDCKDGVFQPPLAPAPIRRAKAASMWLR
jgi:RHS repeat-associated protein